MIDFCIHNIANLYTLDPSLSSEDNPLGCISNGAIGFSNRKVSFIGSTNDAPSAKVALDAQGCILMPGLVDCHTHALYGGSRSTEFAARLAGASYADILEAGGGIHSTVKATRSASEDELASAFKERLTQMIHKGVKWSPKHTFEHHHFNGNQSGDRRQRRSLQIILIIFANLFYCFLIFSCISQVFSRIFLYFLSFSDTF